MKHLFFFIFLCISVSAKLFAQDAFITFTTDRDCEVSLYEPIDDAYNPYIATKVLSLPKGKPVTCQTPISSFALVNCKFSHNKECNLLLFPNDSVKIKVGEQIVFSSQNEAGLDYLNGALRKTTSRYMTSMQEALTKYITQEMAFNEVLPEISHSIIQPAIENIHEELAASATSDKFIETLQKKTQIEANSFLILLLRSSIEIDSYKVTTLKDSIEIVRGIDSIFKATMPLEKETLKYEDNNYIAQYLIFYHGEECPPDSNGIFLGNFGNILYAPTDMQSALLGKACVLQLRREKGSIDLPKALMFLESHFPDSEYIPIVEDRLKEKEINDEENFDHQYIEEEITMLSELKDVDSLANKYLFVDLWASWCMPCRKEFNYQKQLHQVLSNFANVASVYISIDEQQQADAWRSCIKRYQLNGFHLRASEALVQDIQNRIYGENKMEIPHYVLITPSGEIAHKDLPRPSNYLQLEEMLKDIIKPSH